jgi:hypothetical protein
MRNLKSTVVLIAILAAVLGTPAGATEPREPLDGAWKLNVAKSTFTQPGPRAQLRTYVTSNGVENMTARGIDADRKTTLTHYEARYDGKDYDMVGSAGGNKVSLRRVDAYTTEISQKHDGKPTVVATRRVSQDGKTLTVTTKGMLPDGKVIDATMLFERQ